MSEEAKRTLREICEYALERYLVRGINVRTAESRFGLSEEALFELMEMNLVTYKLQGDKNPVAFWMPTNKGLVLFHSMQYEQQVDETDYLMQALGV